MIAFVPVIQSQGTDEQIAKWLTASKRHAILGCYAQTELRHVVVQETCHDLLFLM